MTLFSPVIPFPLIRVVQIYWVPAVSPICLLPFSIILLTCIISWKFYPEELECKLNSKFILMLGISKILHAPTQQQTLVTASFLIIWGSGKWLLLLVLIFKITCRATIVFAPTRIYWASFYRFPSAIHELASSPTILSLTPCTTFDLDLRWKTVSDDKNETQKLEVGQFVGLFNTPALISAQR